MHGQSFFMIITSRFRLNHPFAVRHETCIRQSCMANEKMTSLPYRNLEPPISSGILPNIFNCAVLIYPGFIQVKQWLTITKSPEGVYCLQKL